MADQSLGAVLNFLRAKFPDAFKALTASLLESESGAPVVPPKSLDSTSSNASPSTTDTEEMELDSPLSPENPDDAGGLFTEVRNKKKRKKRSSPASSSASSSSPSPVPQKAPRPCPQLEPGSSQPVQIPALMAIPVESTQPPLSIRPAPPAARALLDKKPPPIYIQAQDKWPMIQSAMSNKFKVVAAATAQGIRMQLETAEAFRFVTRKMNSKLILKELTEEKLVLLIAD
ncbi:hypothetical protein RR48_01045 [Papilio machaon]|uniref:Uncharacterized protein n=1 Tax=Papilio machaon TaxID=76193 RepID=A0A0N0PC90_PAPMA|nr:hypothetical protein RR48_01045 [Papilio machaon]